MMRLPLPAILLLAAAGCDLGVPGVPPPPGAAPGGFALPALHAEPDPVAGGRIVDAHGREVILRGVNVNAFVEYWAYDPARFTTYPLGEEDARQIAALGFTAVRLLLSWSRVEPAPGAYDEAYLDGIEAAIALLERHGLYSIVDLHQDAWGPTLAARPGEVCDPGSQPAFGWDGAPGWATLDGGAPRCAGGGVREFSLAVMAAFQAFWDDRAGPGGVGIRTRYTEMLGHLAERFSRVDAVAGYDVMNEPNALYLIPGHLDALADLYADAVAAIRAGEARAGAPARLVVFEPGITWAGFGFGAPPPFPHDGQVVYSPHVYQGGLDGQPLDARPFEQARAEAAAYGGAPVLIGEWGGDPRRAADPHDPYFQTHVALQDRFRTSATIWTWREACGDPHKAGDVRDGRVPYVWGFFDVDCTRDEIVGPRAPLAAVLRRPALRAAPGAIAALSFDAATGRLEASGEATAPSSFVAFAPAPLADVLLPAGRGVALFSSRDAPGGKLLFGHVRPGPWRLVLNAAPPP